MIVLSEHLEECRDVRGTVKLLQEVLIYYSQATPKTVAIVEFAVARLGHGHSQGQGHGHGNGNGHGRSKELEQNQMPVQVVPEGTHGPNGSNGVGMEGTTGFDSGFSTGAGVGVGTTFEGDMDWGFPTLEDLFSGSFANNIPWEAQNYDL